MERTLKLSGLIAILSCLILFTDYERPRHACHANNTCAIMANGFVFQLDAGIPKEMFLEMVFKNIAQENISDKEKMRAGKFAWDMAEFVGITYRQTNDTEKTREKTYQTCLGYFKRMAI